MPMTTPSRLGRKWTRALQAAVALLSLSGIAYCWAAAEPQAFTVNQTPLFISAPAPNVLLLLDNSNSFDENPDGIPVGSNHNTSKSIIARAALRGIVTSYQGKINLGLMDYKLNNGAISAQNLTPAVYDASYEPTTYDPTYTTDIASTMSFEAFPYAGWGTYGPSVGSVTYTTPAVCSAPFVCPWGAFATPGQFQGLNWTDNPTNHSERRGKMIQYANLANVTAWYLHPYDFIYYNLIQADYGDSLTPGHCYARTQTMSLHREAAGSPIRIGSSSVAYDCYPNKTGPVAGFKPDVGIDTFGRAQAMGTASNYGFSGASTAAGYTPSDSDQAQGFTSFGRVTINLGNSVASLGYPAAPAWNQQNAVGYGALEIPIASLTAAQATTLNSRLQCNIPDHFQGGGSGSYVAPANTTACDNTNGIINAGATPSPGALRTALRYFQGNLTNSENNTGVSTATLNTTGASSNNLPNSCGKNYVIFVTDGMPSHDVNGNIYASPATALADTVAQAASIRATGALVYVIGFGSEVQQSGLDQIAAAGGTATSFAATDAASLNSALSYVFNDVIVRSSSAASVATNSAQFSVDTSIYQARFTTADWSGQLLKFQTDNATGAVAALPDWDASAMLSAQPFAVGGAATDNRQIVMGKRPGAGDPAGDTVGIPFAWPATPATPLPTEMYSWQSAALNKNYASTVDSLGSLRLAWMRGDRTNEGATSPRFRVRSTILGDVVNSFPLYVGPPSSTLATEASYRTFKTTYASRRAVLAAGANDGMFHLFDAATGKEVFAYVPSSDFVPNPTSASPGPLISQLTRLDYKANHTYLVDGTPVVEDVYYGSAWHSVLVAGISAGGQRMFALNITNTSNDATKPDPVLKESSAGSVVLWEFGDKNTNTGSISAAGVPTGLVNGDPDLGYTFSKPYIAKAHNGKWVAIFGNGYNNTVADGSASSTGRGALYVVDVETGRLIRKIPVPVGTAAIPNGLGTPRGLDANLTGYVDYAYAGDLYGNLWKFDLTDADPANWAIAFSGSPLFTINNVNGAGQRRPITSDLRVTPNPNGGYMILFGSGRYLATSATDLPLSYTSESMDALYSVWDTGNAIPLANSRAWLNGQQLQNATTVSGNTYRQLTSNAATMCSYGNTPATQPGCKLGCYVDLKDYPNAGYDGERFTYFPQLQKGQASFNTIIPSSNVCSAGGNSEQVIFDYLTCTSANGPSPFDVNGDTKFSASDLISFVVGTPAAPGSKLLSGITPPGTRVYNTASGQVYVYNSSSLGGNPTQDRLKFASTAGRVSWRPLDKNTKK